MKAYESSTSRMPATGTSTSSSRTSGSAGPSGANRSRVVRRLRSRYRRPRRPRPSPSSSSSRAVADVGVLPAATLPVLVVPVLVVPVPGCRGSAVPVLAVPVLPVAVLVVPALAVPVLAVPVLAVPVLAVPVLVATRFLRRPALLGARRCAVVVGRRVRPGVRAGSGGCGRCRRVGLLAAGLALVAAGLALAALAGLLAAALLLIGLALRTAPALVSGCSIGALALVSAGVGAAGRLGPGGVRRGRPAVGRAAELAERQLRFAGVAVGPAGRRLVGGRGGAVLRRRLDLAPRALRGASCFGAAAPAPFWRAVIAATRSPLRMPEVPRIPSWPARAFRSGSTMLDSPSPLRARPLPEPVRPRCRLRGCRATPWFQSRRSFLSGQDVLGRRLSQPHHAAAAVPHPGWARRSL